MIEYIITDAGSNFADDRVRALTLWESWRGYDVKQYQAALHEAFKPFTQYTPAKGQRLGRPPLPKTRVPA